MRVRSLAKDKGIVNKQQMWDLHTLSLNPASNKSHPPPLPSALSNRQLVAFITSQTNGEKEDIFVFIL